MAEETVETAAQLYRAMKKRGLELRTQGDGRDQDVYADLQTLLGCPPNERLQDFLDKEQHLSAMMFLRAFRGVARPFAQMFEEIWNFLSAAAASLANEAIRIRVGYPDAADKLELDLEMFRRSAERASRISRNAVWSRRKLESLISQGWDLQRALGQDPGRNLYGTKPRYEMFGVYPIVQPSDGLPSAFADVVRGLTEAIEAASHYRRESSAERWLHEIGVALTDVLPSWVSVLEQSASLPQDARERFANWFAKEFHRVDPDGELEERCNPIDEIDLPFWRHRWHTFEIWVSVVVLRTLEKAGFAPRLKVEDNYLPVDGYARAVLADLSCENHTPACVAIQVQTALPDGSREIRPDLRIFASPDLRADDSLVVVESKQRAKMTAQHLIEVTRNYRAGCPNASGIIVVNYDAPGLSVPIAGGCSSLESVRPRHTLEFENRLAACVEESGLKPLPCVAVLVDCSASMAESYNDDGARCALRAMLHVPTIKFYAFAGELLAERPHLDERGEVVLPDIKGETAITGAIMSMMGDLGRTPDVLVIVSDGGYEKTPILNNLPSVVECTPTALASHADAIIRRVRPDRAEQS